MAFYDSQGNYIRESQDGQDYWLSDDGLVSINENGEQVDSHGNVAFGSLPTPPPRERRQWRPIETQQYRPPNFDIRLWRG